MSKYFKLVIGLCLIAGISELKAFAKDPDTYYVDVLMVMQKDPEMERINDTYDLFQKTEEDKLKAKLTELNSELKKEPYKSKMAKRSELYSTLDVLNNKSAIGTLTKEEVATIDKYIKELTEIEKDVFPILSKIDNEKMEYNSRISEKKNSLTMNVFSKVKLAIEGIVRDEYKNKIIVKDVESAYLYIPQEYNLTDKVIEKIKNK